MDEPVITIEDGIDVSDFGEEYIERASSVDGVIEVAVFTEEDPDSDTRKRVYGSMMESWQFDVQEAVYDIESDLLSKYNVESKNPAFRVTTRDHFYEIED
ncbi:hypothetical protein GLT90_01880 [Nanohaloarchaea archaeon H12]|nr:hypothetical protein [Nanohaloarchaea archaeon H12]